MWGCRSCSRICGHARTQQSASDRAKCIYGYALRRGGGSAVLCVAEAVGLDVVGLGVLAHPDLLVSVRREEQVSARRQQLASAPRVRTNNVDTPPTPQRETSQQKQQHKEKEERRRLTTSVMIDTWPSKTLGCSLGRATGDENTSPNWRRAQRPQCAGCVRERKRAC
jgi:hypothetical protein